MSDKIADDDIASVLEDMTSYSEDADCGLFEDESEMNTVWPNGLPIENMECGKQYELLVPVITEPNDVSTANITTQNSNDDNNGGKQNSVNENETHHASVTNENSVDAEGSSTNSTSDTTITNMNVGQSLRTRKRQVKKQLWKSEIRKRSRVSGLEYKDRKGKIHVAKSPKYSCKTTCRFKCTSLITSEQQIQIHKAFWSLSDSGKNNFYGKFIERTTKNRTRSIAGDSDRNRVFSFTYYLGLSDNRLRVCQDFFLNTLNISKRRIYYFFNVVYNYETGTSRSPIKGKNTKSHVNEEAKERVREHIKSFACVESHYCRKDSKKKYLEAELSLTQMYRLYKKSVTKDPVKESLYRHIFNSEFNLEFYKPRKDRCDHCEAFKAISKPSSDEIVFHDIHIKEKDACKSVRDNDRALAKEISNNVKTCFVCFDLENVFSLPKAEVSNFFYKRKLSAYNLTAHCSFNGEVLICCAVWHELIAGRTGNHLASAVTRILSVVLDWNKEIKNFIMWSDSCVPQNKNSIMTLALQTFLANNTSIDSIIQRFSIPGHGAVQEVDAVHSMMEKWLRHTEVFSPLGLIQKLVYYSEKIKNNNMKIIQLTSSDFLDFQSAATSFLYSVIPYSKIKYLQINSENLLEISYGTSYVHDDKTTVSLRRVSQRLRKGTGINKSDNGNGNNSCQSKRSVALSTCQFNVNSGLPTVRKDTEVPRIGALKKEDIESMFKYMPQIDKDFYTAIFKDCLIKNQK